MSRTLYRAALIAGSVTLLARSLEVPEETLRRWIQGEEDPAPAAFLAALEFVLAELDRHNSPTN
jgi:transposase-like protein